jgi:glycosyltransferase involved in cell wall biosynthesis
MKRVLIITYFYAQPYNVGGAIRVQKFVRYLPEFGWHPIVLTTPTQIPPDAHQAGSAQFVGISPILFAKKHPIISSYTWLLPATRAAVRIAEREQADVILANCGPFVASLVGVHVTGRTGVPTLADFRDAWSFNPYGGGARQPSEIMESYVLRRIQFLTTTTPGTTQEYVNRYPFLEPKIQTLYNGFDEEAFPSTRPRPFDHFTIVSAGALYAERQPDLLLKAMRQLPERQIRLVVMGTSATDVEQLAARYGVSGAVTFLGRLSHREALREMCRAQMLLLLQGPTTMRCTPIAGKTFEYIRSGLPILAILPEGDNANFLREHASQAYVITSYSVADIAEAMDQCYNDWQAGSLRVQRDSGWEASFNRREITRQMAILLDDLTKSRQQGLDQKDR